MPFTTRKLIPYPSQPTASAHVGWQYIREIAEGAENVREGHRDFMQAGIVADGNWEGSGTTIDVDATGNVFTTGVVGGEAWLPDPILEGGTLLFANTAGAGGSGLGALALKPSVLPALGLYRTYWVEVEATTWGLGVKYYITADPTGDTASLPLAENHGKGGPGPQNNRIILSHIIIHNVAGTYTRSGRGYRAPLATPIGPDGANVSPPSFQLAGVNGEYGAFAHDEIESSTRGAVVFLLITAAGGATERAIITVKSGGTVIAEPYIPFEAPAKVVMQFFLPQGVRWGFEAGTGPTPTVEWTWKSV